MLIFLNETLEDILKIHKWNSTENYANDIVLIKLNQQDSNKKRHALLRETSWNKLKIRKNENILIKRSLRLA